MAGPDDAAELVAIIPKNSREDIRISRSTFRGVELVDVRVYADSDRGDDRVPTKKGIAIRLDSLPALIEALQRATTAA